MDIKVRELTDVKEKSVQEVEQQLLDKHEAQQKLEFDQESKEDKSPPAPEVKSEEKIDRVDLSSSGSVKEGKPPTKKEEEIEKVVERPYDELKEEDVLSYIGKRYGKKINSVEELITAKEEAEPLPENVAAFLKYQQETGRGFEDYVKLQKDYSNINSDTLLKEYLTVTEEGLDPEDIDSLMEDYTTDEELDDEVTIKKIKLTKKKAIAKAKKFFKEQQALYKQPLESRESSASTHEEVQAYRQYIEEAKAQQDVNTQKSQWFSKKSDEVFSPEFKGFKFKINDGTEMVYTPGSASELKKAQESPYNFVSQYLDSNGFLKDAEGYHKSLAIAMNPDKFARHFYEQGKSQATDDVLRKTKNVDMTEHKTPEVANKGGFQVRSISQPSSRGLKIKSIKKS